MRVREDPYVWQCVCVRVLGEGMERCEGSTDWALQTRIFSMSEQSACAYKPKVRQGPRGSGTSTIEKGPGLPRRSLLFTTLAKIP